MRVAVHPTLEGGVVRPVARGAARRVVGGTAVCKVVRRVEVVGMGRVGSRDGESVLGGGRTRRAGVGPSVGGRGGRVRVLSVVRVAVAVALEVAADVRRVVVVVAATIVLVLTVVRVVLTGM